MRPRKPLDEAIKFYQQTETVKQKSRFNPNSVKSNLRDSKDQEQAKTKIVEVEVRSARSLRISGQSNAFASQMMKPFFTYDFY